MQTVPTSNTQAQLWHYLVHTYIADTECTHNEGLLALKLHPAVPAGHFTPVSISNCHTAAQAATQQQSLLPAASSLRPVLLWPHA
jgi:hypothetical protein